MYYQKKKSAMGYSTQYGSSYPKKEAAPTEQARPGTTHSRGHGTYKRSSTGKYTSTTTAAKTSSTDKEKYKKYYHAKTYKM